MIPDGSLRICHCASQLGSSISVSSIASQIYEIGRLLGTSLNVPIWNYLYQFALISYIYCMLQTVVY
jgi:hypothetical protein